MNETDLISGFNEPFSALSHLLGAGVFLLLSFPLLRLGGGNLPKLMALGVFALASVFMLSVSGIYHGLSPKGGILQRLDHSAIFILIVGTMTPIHQMLFQGVMRWGWLLLVWLIAITALTLKNVFFTSFPEGWGLALFLGLGWLGAVSVGILWYREGSAFIKPLLAGGLAYTVGAVLEFAGQPLFLREILGPHELFHLAVLIGLGFHWKFIYTMARRDNLSTSKPNRRKWRTMAP
ncbi:PAQR family membrane homeostasis protein TrhA [Nitrosococcus wardiae]|uniref:DNA-binding protein n=1 Tax=Nitrosococcus wardiae TaxID=1814290 RepID=A0A4P7BXY8_9GAMM|nr:hemolysin III family protein [Nitrosococcus wardiae]QBQ55048.1 DNA-binding protein [Nitrosococcus wardiae]